MENEVEEQERAEGSRRSTKTLRTAAARQVAVNFMPSRQLSYSTLRLRRTNSEHNALLEDAVDAPDSGNEDKQAEQIVREMEQHQRLMEDNPESEELRREALRDLPQGLTMKRTVRAKLSASVSLRSKRRPISVTKRLKYRMSFAFKKLHDRLRDLTFSIELWYEAIRTIEGHFGSAVGSFFYFLRWLFALNLVLCVLIVAFLVVPQALHTSRHNGTQERTVLDFVSGRGFLEDSLLFYGHYHDGNVGSTANYNMPFAYFFTMTCLYLMFFGALCFRTAYSYRRNFIETSGGLSHAFSNKLFCGWDFGIVTNHAAALNAASIYNEFKELLSEQNKKKAAASRCVRFLQCCANVIITVLVLGCILALEYGLWLLLEAEPSLSHWETVVSAALTGVLAACPLLLSLIVRLEFYGPRTAVYVTLARTWLLYAGTMMLLFYYSTRRPHIVCWETAFGQETYRLVLLDAVVSLVLVPLLEFLRALVFELHPSGKPPEFDITYNSLTVIYNQTLLWFGMLFSPLLVVAVTIKFLLLFYVKRECAVRACQPARKVWRAAQTQTIFYMFVTLSLFTTLFGIGSLFFWSSSQCGPFRSYEHVYAVVSEGVLQLSQRPGLHRALRFLTRPGFVAFMLLALCVAVYYGRARARAQQSMVRLLRHMLRLQAQDKDFLLAAIGKVSNGEWLYSPKTTSGGPDSHTWRYLNEVRKPSNAGFHFDVSKLSHSLAEGRPRSYAKDSRPHSYHTERPKSTEDGDTDSSFSWQGSSNYLSQRGDVDDGENKLF